MKQRVSFLGLLLGVAIFTVSCSPTSKVNETSNVVETTNVASDNKAPVLSNELFKIDMPQRFDGLYDTEVNEHTINIYDKESKEKGNPGWVFGIQAFENANDYSGGPTEKVGELTLNSGKVYDIIISYPTESQFGFSNDGTILEMPEKYKSMYDARYEIAGTTCGNNGEKVSVGAGTKGENLYKDVLDKHLTAIKEGWDATKLESENMSTMYNIISTSNDSLSKVGYCYKDINIDGIEELLIGEIGDGEYQGIVYDIYTMVDRKVAHVASGWDRNRYFILDGGLIRNEYSNGANESGVNIYNLTSNSTELFLQIAYKYDGYTDEKNPLFKSYDVEHYESITEEEYNEFEERFGKKAQIDYKSFSTLN